VPFVCRPRFFSSHLQPNTSFIDNNQPPPEHHYTLTNTIKYQPSSP
jgi:hypothetical protein